ncbi:NADPH-dependent 7-cyano-7-deazaguanine reductase [Vibrio phage 1.081.O._10N.286.52.C2]|nr:NADPH-dependent 7-cyano-7-deazaguanine reductase [Vibrio phage 1.081.O._10N.286.52.C2]
MSENYDKVSAIAAEHLGKKAGDYSDFVDIKDVKSDLLVAIPRELNRVDYNIDNDTFVGIDAWHGFEVSALTKNGLPVSGMVKVVYPSNSPNIVESKSMKLYWNSFNMAKIADNSRDIRAEIERIATADLSECMQAPVQVTFFTERVGQPHGMNGFAEMSKYLSPDLVFDADGADTGLLVSAGRGGQLKVMTNNLRSNCRVTHQPDFGDLYIDMIGTDVPTIDSLMQYIVSFRKENHFHEECVEMIYKALQDTFEPSGLMVTALYTRRGGWNICPSRASHESLLPDTLKSASVSHTNGSCLFRQ